MVSAGHLEDWGQILQKFVRADMFIGMQNASAMGSVTVLRDPKEWSQAPHKLEAGATSFYS